MNPFRDINWRPKDAEIRSFGLTLAAGLPVIALILAAIARWRSGAWPVWPVYAGAGGVALGLLSVMSRPIGVGIYRVWNLVGGVIGWVVSSVLLVIVFWFVITPVGLLLRVFGRDPLERKWDRQAPTYWKDAEKPVDAKSYFRQF
jgi:hypothetical protein